MFIKFVVQAGKSPVLLNLVKLIKLFKAGSPAFIKFAI